MIGHVARNEWRLLRRERYIWLLAAAIAMSVSYAVWNGAAWKRTRASEVESILAESTREREQLRLRLAKGEPGGFTGYLGAASTAATLTPGALSDAAIGHGDLHPFSAKITVAKRHDELFTRYQLQSPLTLLSGHFDLTFVVIFLLPLFILASSYDLLSADKERGTLALALSQPVALRTLLVGKLSVRLLAVLGSTLALCLLGLLTSGDLDGDRVARLGVWLAVASAYGLFWLALATAVAACGWRSETNAMVLAAAWLLLVLVVPTVLHVAARVVHPVPSRLAYVSAMRAASNEASKQSAALLARYYHEHPELGAERAQAGFLPRYFASQREVDRRLAPVIADYEARLTAQRGVVARLAALSPAVAAQEAFEHIAGSSIERQQRFREQTQAFLSAWHQRLSPKIFRGEEPTGAELDALPHFVFDEAPMGALLGRVAIYTLWSLVPGAVLLAWSWRRLRAFPVV